MVKVTITYINHKRNKDNVNTTITNNNNGWTSSDGNRKINNSTNYKFDNNTKWKFYNNIAIGNLVKTSISRLITILIETHTTTLNMIIANILIAALTNDLKMNYLIIMKWNHAKRVYD